MFNKRKTIRNIIFIFLLILSVVTMLFFAFTSPYQTWDESVQIIDSDKLLVLRLFWVVIATFNFVMCLCARAKKAISILYFIIAVLGLFKAVQMFML